MDDFYSFEYYVPETFEFRISDLARELIKTYPEETDIGEFLDICKNDLSDYIYKLGYPGEFMDIDEEMIYADIEEELIKALEILLSDK